jgi:hypothetical protein
LFCLLNKHKPDLGRLAWQSLSALDSPLRLSTMCARHSTSLSKGSSRGLQGDIEGMHTIFNPGSSEM